MLGKMISTLGLSETVALWAVAALQAGGYALLSSVPILIPAIPTLNLLLAAGGTAAVIAY